MRSSKSDISTRRQRLLDLLADSAVPTPIDQLAQSLGVSRRTVERDLAALTATQNHLTVLEGRHGGVIMSGSSPLRSPTASRSSDLGMFGRDRELANLEAFLHAATPGVALINGEPGSGKSVLVTKALHNLKRAADPITAWCSPIQSAAALPPLDQVITKLEGDTAEKPGIPVRQASRNLLAHEKAASLVHRLAERCPKPLLLVIEDLHWADEVMSEFLGLLVSGPDRDHVQLIATYRPSELPPEISALLAEVRRGSELLDMPLRPLDNVVAIELIDHVSGGKIGPQLAGQVAEYCQGNPLYLHEYSRLLAENPRERTDIRDVALPTGIVEAVTGRMWIMSSAARKLTEAVATDAEGFTVDELLKITGLGPEQAAAVDEMVSRGFGYMRLDRLYVSHEVVRQAVYSNTGLETRRRLHGLVATALNSESVSPPGRLAHHYFLSDLPDRRRKAIEYSIEAGEREISGLNAHVALDLFELGQKALDAELAPEFGRTIRYGIARARASTEDYDRGHWMLLESFEEFLERGEVNMALKAALWPTPWPKHAASGQIASRAMDLVEQDSLEHGILLSRFGAYLGLGAGKVSEATQTLNSALDIAIRLRDSSLHSTTVSRHAMVAAEGLRLEDARKKAEQGIILSERENNRRFRVHNHFWLSEVELMTGNPAPARTHGEIAFQIAQQSGYFHGMCQGEYARIRGLMQSGSMHTALETYEASPIRRRGSPIALSAGICGAQAAAEIGQPELAKELLLDLLGLSSFDLFVAPPSRVLRNIGQLARIARIARNQQISHMVEHIATATNLEGETSYVRLAFNVGCAIVAHLNHDESMAASALAQLESTDVRFEGPGPFSVQHAAALAASVIGDIARTEVSFEAAIAHCSENGCYAELAWTSIDYANVLLSRADWRSRVRARELTALAVDTARRYGLVAALKEAESIEAKLDEIEPELNRFHLSAREMEVITLAGQGLTDNEIGKRLFLSHHTVTYHVRNALRKTGQPNRAAAALVVSQSSNQPK